MIIVDAIAQMIAFSGIFSLPDSGMFAERLVNFTKFLNIVWGALLAAGLLNPAGGLDLAIQAERDGRKDDQCRVV